MLSLSDEYRPGFQSLLVEIRNGTDSAEALRKVYHKSIDQIEDELRKYADKFAFRSLLFPATLDSKGAKGESGPVEPYLLKLRLADIDYQPEHAAETRMRLAALTEQSPDRPEAYHALAGLALVERRSAEGFELMERALLARRTQSAPALGLRPHARLPRPAALRRRLRPSART